MPQAGDVEAFEAVRDVGGWSQRMRDTHLPVYGEDLQPMWSDAVDAWTRIYAESAGDVCQAQARSIACETLVLHGAKDPICLPEHPAWFAENIPNATAHTFPEGKHNLHLRFADEFNARVRRFLADEDDMMTRIAPAMRRRR